MLRALYRTLWWLAAPVAVCRLIWRARREPGYIRHIGERFGFVTRRKDAKPLIWVHAVSVGETRASQPLVDALRQAHPDAELLVTCMTPAGRATNVSLFGDRVTRCYLPYDMRGAVRRFLKRKRPTLGVVMETEVWPTLIDECAQAGVPLVMVNGRMSEKSFRRAQRFGEAARSVFAGLSAVLAQTEADAHRLEELGARRTAVLGNLKFDVPCDTSLIDAGARWRLAIGDRPVWVAASTREGEEALVLDAFARQREAAKAWRHASAVVDEASASASAHATQAVPTTHHAEVIDADHAVVSAATVAPTSIAEAAVVERDEAGAVAASTRVTEAAPRAFTPMGAGTADDRAGPDGTRALLILVPRHPQRFNEVHALASARYKTVRRSEWAEGAPSRAPRDVLPEDVDVLIGDSMGELPAYYGASDLAFIGGSLVPTGGQNLIEAAAAGTPVLVGPHTYNFTQASANAIGVGAAMRVATPDALGDAVASLLRDHSRRQAMGLAARQFAEKDRGATARTVAFLAEFLKTA
ncbi:3-deoxy-D-manno-octulosonic acid transferase [Robbsia sp. KACC 23696]|uniref:3-deoxy-D-manno-octulosonic acid transferase n=1 Tax=Robbsia sp. KACC 23696 TaxID=3149231 RepID=UPI00325B2C98